MTSRRSLMAIAAIVLPAAALSIAAVSAAAVLTAAVSTAWAEEIPINKMYKDLADHNHYPAAEGLKDALADVKCNITEQLVAAFPDAAGKPIAVKYTWSRPDQNSAPQAKFTITGVPDSTPDLNSRLNTLFAFATPLLADPIWWEFAPFDMKATKEGDAFTIAGAPKAAGGVVKKVTVNVDGSYKVGKLTYDLDQAQISVEFSSKDLGGKWGVEKKTIKRPTGNQIFTYEYAQADGFWLPSKVTIDQTKPDGSPLGDPQYVFEFSNWQVAKAAQ